MRQEDFVSVAFVSYLPVVLIFLSICELCQGSFLPVYNVYSAGQGKNGQIVIDSAERCWQRRKTPSFSLKTPNYLTLQDFGVVFNQQAYETV